MTIQGYTDCKKATIEYKFDIYRISLFISLILLYFAERGIVNYFLAIYSTLELSVEKYLFEMKTIMF